MEIQTKAYQNMGKLSIKIMLHVTDKLRFEQMSGCNYNYAAATSYSYLGFIWCLFESLCQYWLVKFSYYTPVLPLNVVCQKCIKSMTA